ncbi:MAG TPA: hypothetical protein VFK50_02830 [Sphingomicrobium sp.]|nr:hypothetical protein [Sphingomicrobium sp.]
MRIAALALIGSIGALGSANPAEAATVYFYIDAMSLEQRSVKVDLDGPDRAYLCMLPPATSGCQEVPLRRRRS